MDPLHIEYLHMRYTNYVNGAKACRRSDRASIREIDFEVFEYGINKRRLWEGDSPETRGMDRSGIRKSFPATPSSLMATTDWVQYQIRMPVDDTNTIIYWYNSRRREAGQGAAGGSADVGEPVVDAGRRIHARKAQRARHDGDDHAGADHRPCAEHLAAQRPRRRALSRHVAAAARARRARRRPARASCAIPRRTRRGSTCRSSAISATLFRASSRLRPTTIR